MCRACLRAAERLRECGVRVVWERNVIGGMA